MNTTDNTIIICASGSSLNYSDCIKAKEYGVRVIAVNSSWLMVPDCDYIFAADHRWWEANIDTLPALPQRWSNNMKAVRAYNVSYCPVRAGETFNSGQLAIHFAVWLGVKNIILLGFDCSVSHGRHWHGDYPSLSNPGVLQAARWKDEFKKTAGQLCRRVNIINSSVETELTCFRTLPLDEALPLFCGQKCDGERNCK